MKIEVRYQSPYNDCNWDSQWFDSKGFAQKMVEFYLSCGSPAYITTLEDDDVLIIG